MFDILHGIITSPPIQFFLLAIIAGICRSDLNIPEQVTKALAMYLMLAIGLKGGAAITSMEAPLSEVIIVLISGVTIGFAMPFIGYYLLQKSTKLSRIDSAALAAHYGSISVVTFSYAVSTLETEGISYEGYIVTLMALMEAPAIFAGLMLARESTQLGKKAKSRLLSPEMIRDALFNSSIVLLMGGIIIGVTANPDQLAQVTPYFTKPFYAVLCIFLLELGLLTSRQFSNLKMFTLPLVAFAIYMPLIGMALGMICSKLLGLGIGEMILFCTLCASASYIAVPAAMRLAVPKANPALYITSSLAITFPFNLLIGIHLYIEAAHWVHGM